MIGDVRSRWGLENYGLDSTGADYSGRPMYVYAMANGDTVKFDRLNDNILSVVVADRAGAERTVQLWPPGLLY